MPRFRFRLNTLLRLNEATRDERRTELLEAQQVADRVQGQLDELQGELAGMVEANRRAILPGAINVDRLLDAQRYELLLRANELQTKQQLQLVETEVDRRREALVGANREVKVLENWRERLRSQHQAGEQKREGAALDEAAGQRHFREGET